MRIGNGSLFIVTSASAAFLTDTFFSRNLADLATLNQWMPAILMLFVPAVTMGLWADERRSGTDELLLTLPVRDGEVVLGKFLGALGVYTVGLVWFLVALMGLGYGLVEKAPVWLRAVVSVATPLLGYGVWFTISDAFTSSYLPVLVAGLLLVAVGGLVLARSRSAEPVEAPVDRTASPTSSSSPICSTERWESPGW